MNGLTRAALAQAHQQLACTSACSETASWFVRSREVERGEQRCRRARTGTGSATLPRAYSSIHSPGRSLEPLAVPRGRRRQIAGPVHLAIEAARLVGPQLARHHDLVDVGAVATAVALAADGRATEQQVLVGRHVQRTDRAHDAARRAPHPALARAARGRRRCCAESARRPRTVARPASQVHAHDFAEDLGIEQIAHTLPTGRVASASTRAIYTGSRFSRAERADSGCCRRRRSASCGRR